MGAQQAERDADGEEQPTCTRSKCIGLRVALARERRAGRLMVMAHGESEAGSTGLLRLDLLRSHPRLFDNDMTRDVMSLVRVGSVHDSCTSVQLYGYSYTVRCGRGVG